MISNGCEAMKAMVMRENEIDVDTSTKHTHIRSTTLHTSCADDKI